MYIELRYIDNTRSDIRPCAKTAKRLIISEETIEESGAKNTCLLLQMYSIEYLKRKFRDYFSMGETVRYKVAPPTGRKIYKRLFIYKH